MSQNKLLIDKDRIVIDYLIRHDPNRWSTAVTLIPERYRSDLICALGIKFALLGVQISVAWHIFVALWEPGKILMRSPRLWRLTHIKHETVLTRVCPVRQPGWWLIQVSFVFYTSMACKVITMITIMTVRGVQFWNTVLHHKLYSSYPVPQTRQCLVATMMVRYNWVSNPIDKPSYLVTVLNEQ